jgi:hypothetical protein
MYASLQDLFKTRLSSEFNDKGISFNLLVRIEAGLRLMEILGLEDQPVMTIWALNQGLLVPALSSMQLDANQRRWLANFRAVVHRSSNRDWQIDLGIYAQYPESKRTFTLPIEGNYEIEIFSRTGRQTQRLKIYDDVFGAILPFRKEKRSYASQGQYGFSYNRDYKGEVTFSEKVLEEARKYPLPLLKTRPGRDKQEYSHIRLRELALEMDRLEQENGLKRSSRWLKRIDEMIRFRARRPDGSLSEVNTQPISIRGMTHIAGMVGSGKSTIANLIAYDIAKHQKGQRVTLVVADVSEVLRITEYFNNLLASNGVPVAVPLLGPTMRDVHLTNVFRQKDFSIASDHWRLRFLDTTCLVTQWLAKIDETIDSGGEPGKEPCNALYELNEKKNTRNTIYAPSSQFVRCNKLIAICLMLPFG